MSQITLAKTKIADSQVGVRATAESRLPELDGVRGIAVAAVLLFHVFAWTMESGALARKDWSGVAAIVLKATKIGWLGVDLFFVLSGFLITGILLRDREKPRYFRNFYGRRVLRILPPYLMTLVGIFMIYPESGRFVLLSLLFMANMTSMFGVGLVYGPLWSLAVEEHFYLVWPWVVRRATKRGVLILACTVCISEPIVRAIGFACGTRMFYPSWFRLDGLAWGAALATSIHCLEPSQGRVRLVGYIAIVLGFSLAAGGIPFDICTSKAIVGAALQVTTAHLVFVGLLSLAICSRGTLLGKILSNQVLVALGTWSYCIYLVHWMWMTIWDRLAVGSMPALEDAAGPFGYIAIRAGAVIAATLATAAISFRFFEQPILRLKRHFA